MERQQIGGDPVEFLSGQVHGRHQRSRLDRVRILQPQEARVFELRLLGPLQLAPRLAAHLIDLDVLAQIAGLFVDLEGFSAPLLGGGEVAPEGMGDIFAGGL